VESLPCEESLELLFLVSCVWPLCGSGGLRGKKSTPSIGWEVSVKSWIGKRKVGMVQISRLKRNIKFYFLGYGI
jgi:hypothetical protein